jgi:hypothetical protein
MTQKLTPKNTAKLMDCMISLSQNKKVTAELTIEKKKCENQLNNIDQMLQSNIDKLTTEALKKKSVYVICSTVIVKKRRPVENNFLLS